ncbi:MAG: phage virion morphogenesis protein [Bacteroidaceae bacterium]
MKRLLSVNIVGRVSTQDAINAYIQGLDVEQILDGSYAILLNRIRTRFQQQTDPSGMLWIPSQAALDENRNTLIDTGRLFRSIQLFQSSAGFRMIGTDVPYAPFHHYGRKYGGVTRAFMAFNDEDQSLVERMILDRFKI